MKDTAAFFRKWLRDVKQENTLEYGVPMAVPNILGNSAGIAIWQDAAAVVPWTIYQSMVTGAYWRSSMTASNAVWSIPEAERRRTVCCIPDSSWATGWLLTWNGGLCAPSGRHAESGTEGKERRYRFVFYCQCLLSVFHIPDDKNGGSVGEARGCSGI